MSDKRLFPMTMKLKIQLSDDEILTDFALKQINIDEDFEIPLNIPAKYTQISWQAMLKFIQSL
ncbi:MAG: DUF4292 domain-containing protein, partial [Dysgonamonadaceae bacterium]|jgi:hypothetical protein|nr:DUF4292 domain-containing protein [Dysgonamonadaceae bacterium]